jgi:hypothetical protein
MTLNEICSGVLTPDMIEKIVNPVLYSRDPSRWDDSILAGWIEAPTKYKVWAEKIRQASVARVKPPPAGSSWVDWT